MSNIHGESYDRCNVSINSPSLRMTFLACPCILRADTSGSGQGWALSAFVFGGIPIFSEKARRLIFLRMCQRLLKLSEQFLCACLEKISMESVCEG